MYLARVINSRPPRYYIRESYQDGSCLMSRNLFDLGSDPSKYIRYPGGNGYYYDEVIEDTLEKFGLHPSQDELDEVFWQFLDPEIRRVITGFQRSSKTKQTLTNEPDHPHHLFDQRRMHYLKFGQVGQGNLHRMPAKLFRALNLKSRDEIEQYFLVQERVLHPREIKRYVFTIFDLKQVFEHIVAVNRPQELSRERMDEYFMERLCGLEDDDGFWSGMPKTKGLQAYLTRYVIMYFDHDFFRHSPLGDYVNDFRNRHRLYRPPPSVRVNMAEAARLFETAWEILKAMDARSFMRLYRKQALKHHPDQGGDPDTFVRLTELYEGILRKK